MTRRRVNIIFNDDGADHYVLDGRAVRLEENNVADAVREVDAALRSEGYGTRVTPLVGADSAVLDGFIRNIKGADELVFNLCESAFGKSSFEMHVAALLELYGIEYTGSGPLTLGLALDKGLTKDILNSRDIMTPEYAVLGEPPTKLKRSLKFPLIVKPLREDASIGIDSGAVVKTMKALLKRVDFIISTYKQPAIVEEYIDGREFNIAVLGNGAGARALPPSEIDFTEFPVELPRIVCYEAKWISDSPLYKKSKPVCPANIPAALRAELEGVALKACETMGCRDYARVDVRVGEDGNIKVLEVNPNPDISRDAGLARAAAAAGLDYPRLIASIAEAAMDRHSGAPRAGAGCV